MRRILTIGLLMAGMAVAGCETMQGAGRDMQTAGQLLSEQAANSQVQMGQDPYAAPPVTAAPAPY
ncbi:entericidin A/B family lipoprotein [Paracoccus sp. MA]|uniref:entericidin A/B family lipoprotein n=1 Tax=Paracoccus sp. MA TaxID=2895796 RepID=UPI000FAC6314|nr:entericidin A/B family lipoprotein [Paracoccus sp. MA]RQP04358.1 MAG: entericidin, EcnA/B family [Paracoccus sp. BP8]UFM63781.1 entericidin A/B family lipoprotein [Paracoccus sp. MA]